MDTLKSSKGKYCRYNLICVLFFNLQILILDEYYNNFSHEKVFNCCKTPKWNFDSPAFAVYMCKKYICTVFYLLIIKHECYIIYVKLIHNFYNSHVYSFFFFFFFKGRWYFFYFLWKIFLRLNWKIWLILKS